MKELKDVTDHFKGKVYPVTSAIGQGQIGHRATVLESYNYLCLVEITKGYVSGQFKEFGIFQVALDKDGEEYLSSVFVDYERQQGAPPRYVATEIETRDMYDRMVSAAKVKFFDEDMRNDRKIREAKSKEAAEKLKAENFLYIKDRTEEIDVSLQEMLRDKTVKKLASDNKIMSLVGEATTLEKLKLILKRR